jgi:hypothetical protein
VRAPREDWYIRMNELEDRLRNAAPDDATLVFLGTSVRTCPGSVLPPGEQAQFPTPLLGSRARAASTLHPYYRIQPNTTPR